MSQLVGEVRRAARWLGEHAAEIGGDAAQLSASGHSAGAHLVSYLAAKGPHEHQMPAIPVRALLLVSGIYDLRPITTSFLQPELNLTAQEVAEWSPIEAEQSPDTRVVLVVGHDETEPFHLQAQDLAFAAGKRHAPFERITASGHNHMTIARDLGVPGTQMADLLVECIECSRT
jgi:arylformamidase